MLTKFHLAFAVLMTHGALALATGYPLCTTEPALTLEAGKSFLSAIVHSPIERRCEATLHFSDPSFLPLRYSFHESECDGSQVLTFTVPKGSPNGDVDIIWQCTGSAPTCNHGIIVGGTADLSIASESTGNVGCLVEVVETRTAPVTITQSSSTFVKMEPTVVVTTTTSFVRNTDSRTTLRTSPTQDSTVVRNAETTRNPTTELDDSHTTTDTAPLSESTSIYISGDTVLDATTLTTIPLEKAETTAGPTGDAVFLSDASKMPISILPAVTASIISTITVFHTVTAKCTS